MATSDLLLELMFSWIKERESCAEKLKTLAKELESLREKCNASECVGSTVAAVGALSFIGAGVATLFTAGAAAPLLGLAGVSSGVGLTVSLGTKVFEGLINSDTMKDAEKIEKESKKIQEKIQKSLEQLEAEMKKKNPYADPDDLDRHVLTEFLRAIARRSGLKIYISTHDYEHYRGFPHGSTNLASNLKPALGVGLGLVTILAFFTLTNPKKKSQHLLPQLAKPLSVVGFKTAVKGGAMVVGGAVGLAFCLDEAIGKWKDQINNNHVTEASQSLRDTADAILDDCQKLRNQFNVIRKRLEQLAAVKSCINKRCRSPKEKKKLMEFAIKECEDEDVRQWLRANLESELFSKLVTMFNLIQQELDEEEETIDREDIDIIFVAHGAIEGSVIKAKYLLPLPTIDDVLLYSPWNCAIDADAAYGVATGRIQPRHRVFKCEEDGCIFPDELHQPTNLPDCWNSMEEAGGCEIPNIILAPLKPKDGAWDRFVVLQHHYGEPGRNRIVIPFRGFRSSLRVPFSVIMLALSLVLDFTPYRATVHLAACLGKISARTALDEFHLKMQYACTIDNTWMTTSEDMLLNRDTKLYRAFKAMFG